MIAISAAEGYELWAESWDATPSPVVAVEERTIGDWVAELHGCVLDVGCGTGRWAARTGAIGLDASRAMVAVAAEKIGLRGRLAVADSVRLPVASSSCDAAICALTLGHVRDRAAAMQELARTIRPGGVLVLTDFHPSAAAKGWRRTFRHDGEVYELENYAYTLEDAGRDSDSLRLEEWREASVGETERELFERAGRPELFAKAVGIPVVMASRWKRV